VSHYSYNGSYPLTPSANELIPYFRICFEHRQTFDPFTTIGRISFEEDDSKLLEELENDTTSMLFWDRVLDTFIGTSKVNFRKVDKDAWKQKCSKTQAEAIFENICDR